MKKIKYLIINAVLYMVFAVIISTSIHQAAYAIPAFARKYQTSCATCHIAVTKRNAFGEVFRRNGYVMPEKNARLIKQTPLNLGAEAWKEVWPDAIWPSNIPGALPIAAATNMRAQYDIDKTKSGNGIIFDIPFDFNFLFGGAFGEDISFLGGWSYKFGFNRFYFRFNDIFGPKDYFNLKVGAFEPGITDGYTMNQRLTIENTAVHEFAADGEWRPRVTRGGIELTGIIEHWLQYSMGVVNSSGSLKSKNYIKQDFYGRLAYKFGGYGLDGEGMAIDSNNKFSWDEESFTLGLYAYSGNAQKTDTSVGEFNNAFLRYGIDARYQFDDFDFLAGAIIGTDEYRSPGTGDISSLVYFIESDYLFYPWLIGAIRYENVKSKNKDTELFKYANIVPNITILFRQNIKISIEGLIKIEQDRKSKDVVILRDKDIYKNIKLNLFCAF